MQRQQREDLGVPQRQLEAPPVQQRVRLPVAEQRQRQQRPVAAEPRTVSR
ncbi:hypothetical protein [Actinomadura geliboluensis]